MKIYQILIIFLTLTVASSSFAHHSKDTVQVNPHEVKIQVSGVVCSFCAFGVQKKLSKLKFLDMSRFTKGVHVDIDNQLITIALDSSKQADLKTVYKSIKSGGYEPQVIHLNITGSFDSDTMQITNDDGAVYTITNGDAVSAFTSGKVSVQGHFDAVLVVDASMDKPIGLFIDDAHAEVTHE
jgi:copper chaperone CopZ